MNTDTSTINPFREIVDSLADDWIIITISYLDWIHGLLEPLGIPLKTYGDTFKVLEFLSEAGAIDLRAEKEHHLIRKRQYFGENI